MTFNLSLIHQILGAQSYLAWFSQAACNGLHAPCKAVGFWTWWLYILNSNLRKPDHYLWPLWRAVSPTSVLKTSTRKRHYQSIKYLGGPHYPSVKFGLLSALDEILLYRKSEKRPKTLFRAFKSTFDCLYCLVGVWFSDHFEFNKLEDFISPE